MYREARNSILFNVPLSLLVCHDNIIQIHRADHHSQSVNHMLGSAYTEAERCDVIFLAWQTRKRGKPGRRPPRGSLRPVLGYLSYATLGRLLPEQGMLP